jgi:general secretion pathway protein G
VQRRSQSGLTTVELLAALGVLLVLVSVAIPLKRWDEKRRREDELRVSLQMMREAIDQYYKAAREGRIPKNQMKDVAQLPIPNPSLDQGWYPRDLDELVEGVEVTDSITPGSIDSGKTHKVHFLYQIPVDPFTGDTEWGKRSYQDDWDATSWGRENVFDVYTLFPGKALDGTMYKDW